jgi:hypothetical protein
VDVRAPKGCIVRKMNNDTPPPSAPLKPVKPRRAPALRAGWMLQAWKRAQARLQAVDPDLPADLIEAVADRTGPVERARGLAELMAPADMILLAGVTHGLAPDEVEAYGKPLRMMADLAQRRLSMVGLKSGEAVEHDMSDRLRSFLGQARSAPERHHPAPALAPRDSLGLGCRVSRAIRPTHAPRAPR